MKAVTLNKIKLKPGNEKHATNDNDSTTIDRNEFGKNLIDTLHVYTTNSNAFPLKRTKIGKIVTVLSKNTSVIKKNKKKSGYFIVFCNWFVNIKSAINKIAIIIHASPIKKLCLKCTRNARKKFLITESFFSLFQSLITANIAVVAGKIVIIGKQASNQITFRIQNVVMNSIARYTLLSSKPTFLPLLIPVYLEIKMWRSSPRLS